MLTAHRCRPADSVRAARATPTCLQATRSRSKAPSMPSPSSPTPAHYARARLDSRLVKWLPLPPDPLLR